MDGIPVDITLELITPVFSSELFIMLREVQRLIEVCTLAVASNSPMTHESFGRLRR